MVKLLPIARSGSDYVKATQENIGSGEYPLSRYLYIYLNKAPSQPLSPIEREFIRFIYSQQGQSLVSKEGYVPISARIAQSELKKVGL